MIKEYAEQSLKEAKAARSKITKKPTTFIGIESTGDYGLYLKNYANCLLNRQIDIFDDSVFLLSHNKVPSACTVSRGMIETYAFSKLLSQKIAKTLVNKKGKESTELCIELILAFTNSSRVKQNEQEKLKNGAFKLEDYHFTEQAKSRMGNMLGSSEHVMSALRALYKDELDHTKATESGFEQAYEVLSEWVHPSQTSIFHNYAKETHVIPTSFGNIHFLDSAMASCIRALHFITDSMNIYDWTNELADELSARCNKIC
ncbi:hypothetical protein G9Q84_11835 [Pseudomonas sp. P7]|uniref:hypothetical protein n=1 Tax=Pseudomonas sivasensis TaxID=1880678 RepID=UPI0015EBAEFB|nr:hypothetical protein [Pseudomonas sivasensis]MBA2923583.1 hypothetical protein [Pseudomonas sivasensis]